MGLFSSSKDSYQREIDAKTHEIEMITYRIEEHKREIAARQQQNKSDIIIPCSALKRTGYEELLDVIEKLISDEEGE